MFVRMLFCLMAVALLGPAHAQVRSFASPEEALQGFIDALRAPTTQPLIEIFGEKVLESIPPEERRADTQRRAAGERLAQEKTSIVYQDEAKTKARAVVGRENFIMPLPLERGDKGWTFNGEAGVAEMNLQRIVANEANALRALRALARAQEVYRAVDRNGDGILEYAQRIRGTEGNLDGLVNDVRDDVPGTVNSLLNNAFAKAEGKPGQLDFYPVGGYGFAIFHAQGPHAEGGAKSLLVNGRLQDGYAVIAWPTRPGVSGGATFIMNQTGMVHERDFGEKTLAIVREISVYDPDDGWTLVD